MAHCSPTRFRALARKFRQFCLIDSATFRGLTSNLDFYVVNDSLLGLDRERETRCSTRGEVKGKGCILRGWFEIEVDVKYVSLRMLTAWMVLCYLHWHSFFFERITNLLTLFEIDGIFSEFLEDRS